MPEEDTERLLLERLKNCKTDEDYFRWLLFVVGFYRGINRLETAKALLERFVEQSDNTEHKAHGHLTLGQIATDEQRFEIALRHFAAALELGPRRKKVVYVLENNMGYCLNLLGRYADGEKHCRKAIEINWTRASGYRNLGLSLQGQGQLVSAAWAFVEAVKADMLDRRARALLEKLLAEHPSMAAQCPWLAEGLSPDASSISEIVPA
jgi:tetratricopeptide (TPR) repeat protein